MPRYGQRKINELDDEGIHSTTAINAFEIYQKPRAFPLSSLMARELDSLSYDADQSEQNCGHKECENAYKAEREEWATTE